MAYVEMTPQPFDTAILGGPVYRAEMTSVSQVPFLGTSVPEDAILVSARVPPDWTNVMEAITEFREIERLVSFECPLTPAIAGSTRGPGHCSCPAMAQRESRLWHTLPALLAAYAAGVRSIATTGLRFQH